MEKTEPQHQQNLSYFALGLPKDRTGNEFRRISVEDHIKYSLRAAILTQKGERALRPHLGSDIRQFLFRPLTPGLRVELQTQIRRTLAESEPRVEVEDVEVRSDAEDAARALVSVSYQLKKTRKRDQVRFSL